MSRSRSGAPAAPSRAAGAEQDLARAGGRVAERRDAVRHGAGQDRRGGPGCARRPRRRATSARVMRARSSAPGGSPAPARTPSTAGSSSSAVIASGSVVSALARSTRQPLRAAVATSGASARSEAATTPRRARCRGSHARPPGSPSTCAGSMPSRRASAGAAAANRSTTSEVAASSATAAGQGDRADQAPACADPTDERGTAGRAPAVEGQEGPWFGGHRRHRTRGAGRRPRGQASQAISSSSSSSRAISSSMPVSSARISLADGELATEQAAQHGVEEQHRVGAERPVRPAGFEEMDGRAGQAAQLDLARDLLDQLVAPSSVSSIGGAHRTAGAGCRGVMPGMVRHAGIGPRSGAKVGRT